MRDLNCYSEDNKCKKPEKKHYLSESFHEKAKNDLATERIERFWSQRKAK